MPRSAKAVLIGVASTAAGVVMLVLGAQAAGAEEATTPIAAVTDLAAAAVPTYNGQPIVAAFPVVTAAVPEIKAAAAVGTPLPIATYNGQPVESMKATIENTAPTAAPATSATPASPVAGGNRRIIYSVNQHRVWLVEENGEVSRTYLVSGKAGLPRVGEYKVYSRSARAYSGSVSMRWMVRFARGSRLAIGFHEIPVTRRGAPIQSLGELGQFRSHGCVRQSPDDARHLWDWAPIGTRVTVLR